jgi:SRSO17 transposase
MKETTPAAMPPCFENWCKKLDPELKTQAQKRELRNYLGGLLGESERKNVTQMSNNALGVEYNGLHHFITKSPWSYESLNHRRLKIVSECRQTKIARKNALIIDDSGHRKSGNFTDGVGRQYIGQIGKTDNGNVVVTSHIYDGVRSWPLDIELYKKAESFPDGEKDPLFQKKTEIAIKLIDKQIARGEKPGIILMDGGYGNNSNFLKDLEKRELKYIGGIAKNRNVKEVKEGKKSENRRIDEVAESLPESAFVEIELLSSKAKKVWVATVEIELSNMSGQQTIAIVMNAKSFAEATDIDYLITNETGCQVTAEWIVKTYSQRNWIEVFYREIKGWLGLSEYQLRDKTSLMRHFILVFCAYTFIQWHRLTGGLRRRWANKPLNTFREALEAFHTAVSYRFFNWLNENIDVFRAYKESLGYIWA